MRKDYTLKQPLRRAGKIVAKAGAPVALTRAQFEALQAQGLVTGPVTASDAWPAPRKGAAAVAQPAAPAKPEG